MPVDPAAECVNPPAGPDVDGHAWAPGGSATGVVEDVVDVEPEVLEGVVEPSDCKLHGAQPCDRKAASVDGM